MPLFKKKPYLPELRLPPELKPTDDVWVIRYTGEIFVDYGLYLEKVQLYARRVWGCKYTGRSGLTFEEALISEDCARNSHHLFPALLEGPIIKLAHHSTLKLDDLCQKLCGYLRNHFLPGELVIGKKESNFGKCKIINAVGGAEESPQVLLDRMAGLDSKYTVEWLDVCGDQKNGNLSRAELMRPNDKLPVSKPVLKAWLEKVAQCEIMGVKGIPCLWTAKKEFCEKYTLPSQVPEELTAKLERAKQRKAVKEQKSQSVSVSMSSKEASQSASKNDRNRSMDGISLNCAPNLISPGRKDAKRKRSVGENSANVSMSDCVTPIGTSSPSPPETLEALEARLIPGSIKHAVFKILKGVGWYGASTSFLLQRLKRMDLDPPLMDGKAAKSALGSILAHDNAFTRIGHGHYTLSVLAEKERTETQAKEKDESVEGGAVGEIGRATVVKPPFDRNSAKCSKCHKTYHPDCSPLLLCDKCPRVVHLICTGLDWSDLGPPDQPFSCPKCLEKEGRWLMAEKDREEKQARKLMDKEASLKRKMEEKEQREKQKQKEREELKRRARCPMDDLEVMEMEAADLERIERIRRSMQTSCSDLMENVSMSDMQKRVEGPLPIAPVVQGQCALTCLMDALSVVEFLSTFYTECEVKAMSLEELNHAVAWPLDNDMLAELYMALLRCVLLDQVGQSGTTRSRARRWARVIDHASWPEILKRYLLASREALGIAKIDVHTTEVECMDDQQIALKAADELSRNPFYKIGPVLHLRLLHTLCNDIINCQGMKDEVSGRLEETIQLQAEKYHADAEDRRRERQRKQQMRDEKKKMSKKKIGATPESGKKDSIQNGVNEGQGSPGSVGNGEAEMEIAQNGEEEGNPKSMEEDRKLREKMHKAELSKRLIRTEPCGLDRHHNRYWWLKGDASSVYVESPNGNSVGCISTKNDLDELFKRLNKRGYRESALLANLEAIYDELIENLRPREVTMDVSKVPRIGKGGVLRIGKELASIDVLEIENGKNLLKIGVGHLESLVNGLVTFGVKPERGLKEWRRLFRNVSSESDLENLLLDLERVVGSLADGFPKGGDDVSLAAKFAEIREIEKLNENEGRCVSALDELDNSDVEDPANPDASGSSTRNRRHCLWRSAHERFVWLKCVKNRKEGSSIACLTYAAATLNDRAQPLLEKFSQKQQQASAKLARAESVKATKTKSRSLSEEGRETKTDEKIKKEKEKEKEKLIDAGKNEPIIRTKIPRKRRRESVKDSTDQAKDETPCDAGTEVTVTKRKRSARVANRTRVLANKEETPSTKNGPQKSEEPNTGKTMDVDRWDFTCAHCGLGGEMLCCEAPNCTVAMHLNCTSLTCVPKGVWFCPKCTQSRRMSQRPGRGTRTRKRFDE